MAPSAGDDDRHVSRAGDAPLARLIARKRLAMGAVMLFERAWPCAVAVLSVLALYAALSWFGYFRSIPDLLRFASLALLAAGIVAALVLARAIRWPAPEAIDARLEALNAIPHQAIAVQDDRLESDTPFARALWLEHRRRMAARIADLRIGTPAPDMPRRDPYALRAAVALLAVVAFAFSYSNRAGTLLDAFHSADTFDPALAVRLDAWVTPPAYTGRAPIFLTKATAPADPAAAIAVPVNSDVTVRVTGAGNAEATVTYEDGDDAGPVPIAAAEDATPSSETDKAAAAQTADAGAKTPAQAQTGSNGQPTSQSAAPSPTAAATGGQAARTFRFRVTKAGTLAVAGLSSDRSWSFDVVPDRAPEIAFKAAPTRAVNGALEIAYTLKDDYGVTTARAEIVPVEPAPPGAHPLFGPPDYPLTLPRRGTAEARTSRDLTDHPLAGKRVRITLVANDAAGNVGRSDTREMVLPEHGFSEPLARAVVEQRQTFALDTNRMPRALELADALMSVPEATIPDLSDFLLLRSARARMALARNDTAMRETADYLWNVALQLEDGDLSLAERKLRDAQRALADALQKNAPDAEIQKLMKELRDAMKDYMEALAKNLQNSQQAERQPSRQEMQNTLRQQDLERMMDQIENLARSGQRDQAQQLLSELQRMMNNLQAGRPQQNQGQQNSPMRQQMDKLGELMQQQQKLMDQTYKFDEALRQRMQEGDPDQGDMTESQRQQQPGEQQSGKEDEGESLGAQQGQGDGTDGMTADSLRQALKQLRKQQEALQGKLGQMQKDMQGMGMQPGKGFDEANRQMGDAAGSLGNGQGQQAVGQQGRALQALREGAQDMMNQMSQAMGQQGEGQGQQPGDQIGRNDGRDPLGRPRSTTGPDFGDQVKVPDEIDIQRAREILEEIRKRLGNALSPDLERRYLERLLEMR